MLSDDPPAPSPASEPDADHDALIASLAEIERHVGRLGWDQPARLFALVRTDELVAAEPALAEHLTVTAPDALSSIEQEDFREGEDLQTTLERIQWSEAVAGCALSVERSFLPATFEGELPGEADEAARLVATHPQRQDMRVVVGVLRNGSAHGVGRLRTHPEELLGGPDLVPALARILAGTLQADIPRSGPRS